MELGTLKHKVFIWTGWLSVCTALISFAVLNIFLLWGYNVPIGNNISFWVLLTLIFGGVAVFNKKSRSLGLWGLGLSIYLGFFMAVMFILGWTISPFP
ncbi:hypothetical protein [Bacillus dakarensis]|uniref:hypothetical protein n=1 Tax=Robertmurraya dakarensis TaxID=1926278 RepID=UPI000981585B|nr:hypothetical protein [Bacillus dakarensis]